MSKATPIIYDFASIGTSDTERAPCDDPVLVLVNELGQAEAEAERAVGVVREIEHRPEFAGGRMPEALAQAYENVVAAGAEDQVPAIIAAYRLRKRADVRVFNIRERIKATPATTIAGVLAQVDHCSREAVEGWEIEAKDFAGIIAGLTAIAASQTSGSGGSNG
jgi:hypothetical protein